MIPPPVPMLVLNADDDTFLAGIPSPNMISDVTWFFNRNLNKISAWCNLLGITVSSSWVIFPSYPDLFIGNISLNLCDF